MKLKNIQTISELMDYTLHTPCVEPVKRVKCLHHVPRGQRNHPEAPRYIIHRYPIKGGITRSVLVAENITANNTLLKLLKGKR